MREYKFRGKAKATGEWVYGDLIHRYNNWTYIAPIPSVTNIKPIEVDPETVGQYTGLHDKNVKEIYEGDILRFTHERGDFINTDARIAVEIPKIYYMIDNPYNHSFERIGNIYENPELLKKESEVEHDA
jgi:uncharacterized phage protein (TIGR01671 family)